MSVLARPADRKGGKGKGQDRPPTARVVVPPRDAEATARVDTQNFADFPTLGAPGARVAQQMSRGDLKVVYRDPPPQQSGAHAGEKVRMRVTEDYGEAQGMAAHLATVGKGKKGGGRGDGKGGKGYAGRGGGGVAPPAGILQAVGKQAPRPTKVVPGAVGAKPAPPAAGLWFSHRLWAAVQPYCAMAAHVAMLEREFQELINKHPTAKMLSPMRKEKRALVHELGLYYGLHIESLDPEPNRACLITTLPSSRPPAQLLTAWAKTARPPAAQAAQHLKDHPHHAVVFPSVPPTATLGYFNDLLSRFTGRMLLIRTRQAHTENRDYIAVCFSDETVAALMQHLHSLTACKRLRQPWLRYTDQEERGDVETEVTPPRPQRERPSPAHEEVDADEWRTTHRGPAPQTLRQREQEEKLGCSNGFRGLCRDEQR